MEEKPEALVKNSLRTNAPNPHIPFSLAIKTEIHGKTCTHSICKANNCVKELVFKRYLSVLLFAALSPHQGGFE